MRLITDQLKKSLPVYGSTSEQSAQDIVIHAKFFALGSAATWLVAEFDAEDNIVYGYCDLYGLGRDGGAEWGSTSVAELESLRYLGIPRVERDIHFTPRPFADCVDEEGRIKV